MDDKLDQQSFDQFIKESIEDFKVPYEPSSWSSMEEALEAANLTLDENQPLDDLARNALSDLKVPYIPSTWASLEKTMEKENLTTDENLLVDEQARKSLSDLTVPYAPATWLALSDRLERMDYNQKLLALKVVEFAVFILAILTFVRILNHLPSKQETPAPQTEREFAYEMPGDIQKLESTVSIENNKAASKDNPASSARLNPSSPNNRAKVQGIETTGAPENSRKRLLATIVPPTTSDNQIIERPSEKSNAPIVQDQIPGTYEIPILDTRRVRIENINSTPDLRPSFHYEELAYQAPDVISESYRYAKIPLAGLINQKAKIQTKVGLFSQMNIHQINYKNYQYQDQELVTDNMGFGMMANVQFGKLGFDLGLGYERLKYPHYPEDHLIQKLQAPLHLKFIPVRNKYFNMYVKAGAVFNGALYAKYNEPPTSAAPGPQGNRRDVPKYNDGLLNGGTLQNNFYIASSVGLGFESTVYNQISFFAEGMYQNHQTGEGISIISSDRFTTISVNLGVNYTFR